MENQTESKPKKEEIRLASHAGTWYSKDKIELNK